MEYDSQTGGVMDSGWDHEARNLEGIVTEGTWGVDPGPSSHAVNLQQTKASHQILSFYC